MPTGVVVFWTGSRCWPLSGPDRIAGSGGGGGPGGRPRLRRRALHELLAEQRLQPDLAMGVGAERQELWLR